MKKSILQNKHIVTKQNTLNEFCPKDMALQELRFFTIYLSKINPMNRSTRLVRFPLSDFQAIMELGRIDTKKLKDVADSLLTKVTGLPLESGGFVRFQLFKKCKLDKDKYGEWYIEIDAHDMALPLMFDLKGHYFKYELWNALRLKSKNQLRMYEVLKQYEKVGYRIITVRELKEQLGISANEYPRFGDFKKRVLESCQQALQEHTDIKFIYEPYGKKGPGGKVLQLKFNISKNKNFIDSLALNDFIDKQKDIILENESEYINPRFKERIELLMEACNNTFNFDEISIINDLLNKQIHMTNLEASNYLGRKYKEMMMNDKTSKGIKYKFAYLKKIISVDIDKDNQELLVSETPIKKDKFADIYQT